MFLLRVALTLLGFLAASLYGVAIALLRRDRSRVAHDYARLLVRLTRPALGVRVVVRNRERVLQHRPCIYIANHRSACDVPILAELYAAGTAVIGKKELSRIPFFGWLFRVTGNVLIDRGDNPGAVGRLREAERVVRERGMSVWIFSEGTRGRVPGELLPFKRGAFHMAVATGAPLVPVVVSPVPRVVDLDRRRIRPGRVEVRVLEPIPAAGMTAADVDALIDTARGRMQAALSEMAGGAAREEGPPPPRSAFA